MEKALETSAARPSWLADDQPPPAGAQKPAPAAKAVPWRTPGAAKPAAQKPAAAAPVAPRARQRPKRRLVETHVLPLVFLLTVVLVIGGYLAGWHLG
jgi:hypothetical protein